MRPPKYSRTDIGVYEYDGTQPFGYSRITPSPVTYNRPETDRARQEFKAEADISYTLRRFLQGDTSLQRPSQGGGGFDFTVDKQGAYMAVEAARASWRRLPKALREKYPTWQHVYRATTAGEIPDTSNNKPLDTPAPTT